MNIKTRVLQMIVLLTAFSAQAKEQADPDDFCESPSELVHSAIESCEVDHQQYQYLKCSNQDQIYCLTETLRADGPCREETQQPINQQCLGRFLKRQEELELRHQTSKPSAPAIIPGLIGDDDHVEITDTTKFPYSAIGRLGHRNERGTGFLISENLVLTNAHVAAHFVKGQYDDFVPGDHRDKPAPFGSFKIKKAIFSKPWLQEKLNCLDENLQYRTTQCFLHDFAFLVLEKPAKQLGRFELRAASEKDLLQEKFITAGYAKDYGFVMKGRKKPFFLAGLLLGKNKKLVTFSNVDGLPGDSGSPAIDSETIDEQQKTAQVLGIISQSGGGGTDKDWDPRHFTIKEIDDFFQGTYILNSADVLEALSGLPQLEKENDEFFMKPSAP